tara:strand:- start:1072 stop:1278 length:207 start_codon:yes stop_codon:yes gene_type:complete
MSNAVVLVQNTRARTRKRITPGEWGLQRDTTDLEELRGLKGVKSSILANRWSSSTKKNDEKMYLVAAE